MNKNKAMTSLRKWVNEPNYVPPKLFELIAITAYNTFVRDGSKLETPELWASAELFDAAPLLFPRINGRRWNAYERAVISSASNKCSHMHMYIQLLDILKRDTRKKDRQSVVNTILNSEFCDKLLENI